LQSLTTLFLWGCNNITNKGQKSITQLKRLTTLDLGQCKKITKEGVKSLKQKLPNVKIIR
ncbi:MAG: hypothetical protein KDK40_02095, partial [Chlamydiia bacterium]|nr:hypothetical protein [Chlamydiia bacterium]